MSNSKTILRTVLKNQLGISFRFIPQIRQCIKRGITVFVFHEVSDHPSRFAEEYGLAVSIKTFNRQLSFITSHFNVIHPTCLLKETVIPENAAIISFDDGFLSSFENGLTILQELKIPSIFFLNMHAIIEQKPILSATVCYLNRYVPEFSVFCKSVGIVSPFHLTITPSILNSYENIYGPVDNDAINEYQGQFADLYMIKAWNNNCNVVYGNHLFEHWNASALSIEEFEEQYSINKLALSQLENIINMFSFTNGRFSSREILLLQKLGADKVFSGVGCLNSDTKNYILDRISLGGRDIDENSIWFKIGLSFVQKQVRKNLHF